MNRKNNFFKKLSKYNKEARTLGYKWKDLIKKDTRQKIINEITTQREIKIRVKNIITENKKWSDLTKKDTGQKFINEIKTQREIKTRVKNIIMENKKLKDLIEKKFKSKKMNQKSEKSKKSKKITKKDEIERKKQKKIELNKKKLEKRKKITDKINTQREIKLIVKKIISENKESNKIHKFFKIKKTKKAFNNYTSTYKIKVNYKDDPLKQLNNTKYDIIDFLKRKIPPMNGIKFNMNLQITFYKRKDVDLFEYKTAYFQSKPQILINNISINESYDIAKDQILTFIAQWI